MYSDEMFKMLKSADYNKIAWSKRASEIHAKLVTSVAKAAKTSKFSEKEIDDILNQYFKGKKIKIRKSSYSKTPSYIIKK